MKKAGILILFISIIINGFSQNVSAESQSEKKEQNRAAENENTQVTLGNNKVRFEESDSTLDLKVGNRGLQLLESLEGPRLSFKKYSEDDDWDNKDNERFHYRRADRFRGHWTAIEFGFNNYVTSDNSFSVPSDIDYMSLNSGKSGSFNINFSQLNIGFTRHIGLVTGLGLNWNNYKFDGDNSIIKGVNGVIEEFDPGTDLKKSKLATIYMHLPVLLEIQIPVDNHCLNIAAGPIGAIKLGSHTKMVYESGQKVKSYKDFSLNMLRYGGTARVGYGNFQIYGTYYVTPLFQSGKGPAGYDLYPFEVGIAFTFND
jgi:hypothetical protein